MFNSKFAAMEQIDWKNENLEKYGTNYSEPSLWKKIGKFAAKAGLKVIYYALILYYSLKSDKVSKKEKALIIGALGYFILPVDLVPDLIPGVGFADDAAALLVVIRSLTCVDFEIKNQAKYKLREWFSDYDESEIDNI